LLYGFLFYLPMIEHFPFYLSLILAIVLLIMLADKIKVASRDLEEEKIRY
jgi:hypothetical protein